MVIGFFKHSGLAVEIDAVVFKQPRTICMVLFWITTWSGTEAFIYLLNTVLLPEPKSRNFIHEQELNQEPAEVRDGFHLLQNHNRQREFTQNITHNSTTHSPLLWAGVSWFCAWLEATYWLHSVSQKSFLDWLHAVLTCLHTSWLVCSLLRAQGSTAHTWLKNVRYTDIVLVIPEI